MTKNPISSSKFNFSKATERLDEIIVSLDSPSTKLEDAVKLFDEGSQLAEQIHSYLATTQLQINTVKEKLRNIQDESS